MIMAKARMGLRRGDIVWARVLYPKKWWPGFVSSIDGHYVAVSFFDDGENPSYFLETEVCSFEENFESLIRTLKNCIRGEELLDNALKLLARRTASSLKCPCHFRPSPKGREISRRNRRRSGGLFRPDALLKFVFGLAISPFVGVSDLVNAVTAAAQLHAFRRYVIGEQKLHGRDNCSSLSPLPTAAQKSNASKLEFEPLNEDQPNSGLLIHMDQTKTQSSHAMLVNLHRLAFRDLEGQTNFNFEVKKCSHRSRELQLSHLSVKVNGEDCRDIFPPPKPFVASPTEFLGLKRQYDPPVDSDFCFKLCKTMPFFSINGVDADIQKGKFEGNVCELDFLSSFPAMSFSNRIYATVQINRTRCGENKPGSCFSGSQLDVGLIDHASVETRSYLPSFTTSEPIQMEHSSGDHNIFVETNKQESINEAFRESFMDNKLLHPLVTSDSSFSGSQLDAGLTDHVSAETRNYLPSPTTDHIQMERSIGNHNASVEINRQESIKSASRESSMENKLLHPSVTSKASSSMPLVAQQSADSVFDGCQCLRMKFPRDFRLPSKEDLIKKFRRFGQIDLFRTKIFTHLGSAQVVFLHQLDAVTAYQYSKRKKILFGEANVRFWLDPYEKKRSRSRLVAPQLDIKSCLKNSDLRREDKKNAKKVRFLIETCNR